MSKFLDTFTFDAGPEGIDRHSEAYFYCTMLKDLPLVDLKEGDYVSRVEVNWHNGLMTFEERERKDVIREDDDEDYMDEDWSATMSFALEFTEYNKRAGK